MAATEVLMSVKCYVKIVMHSLKYPHATTNGVMITEKKKKKDGSGSYLELVDCIPLFHLGHGLTPMLEVALHQISNYYKNSSLSVGGYYQANKYFVDSSPNVFAQKIAEKIWDHNNDALLLMLNNFGLASSFSEANDPYASINLFNFVDNKWKAKTAGFRIEQSDDALTTLYDLVFSSQTHLNLVDFDNHLDDVNCDWTNKHINEIIESKLIKA